jgi:hypothetical protein
MTPWEIYESRVHGTKRENRVNGAREALRRKWADSLFAQNVVIGAPGGEQTRVAILSKAEIDTKKICSLESPLLCGSLVEWAGEKWLILETDAQNEIYESGVMQRCNYLLKWRNEAGLTVERWGIVKDGTRYLDGEKERAMLTVGDARLVLTLGKDEETAKLRRGQRFLIDDPAAAECLAYQISKPNRLFSKGVYRFVLTEVNSSGADDKAENIAAARAFEAPENAGKEDIWI